MSSIKRRRLGPHRARFAALLDPYKEPSESGNMRTASMNFVDVVAAVAAATAAVVIAVITIVLTYRT